MAGQTADGICTLANRGLDKWTLLRDEFAPADEPRRCRVNRSYMSESLCPLIERTEAKAADAPAELAILSPAMFAGLYCAELSCMPVSVAAR
jgi:hypothetical protein